MKALALALRRGARASRPRSRRPAARRTSATASRRASACPGRGWSCRRARHGRVPAHVPAGTKRRRRPRRPGDLARRARRLRRPARRAGAARRDDDAVRALPRRLDVAAHAGVPAAPRLHPDAGRRRPLDRLGARRRPPGPALEYRSRIVVIGPGDVKFGQVVVPRRGEARRRRGTRSRSGRSSRRASRTRASSRATHVVVGKKVVVTASATDALSIDAHAIVQVGAECAP